MNCMRYILSLWAMLLLTTACSDELVSHESDLPEGTPITLTFEAVVPGGTVATRGGVETVDNLMLMVFDDKHRYLYRAKAKLGREIRDAQPSDIIRPDGGQAGGINPANPDKKREITVTLLSSKKKRIIHFVANHDFTNMPADYRLEGMDEGELMPSLFQEGDKKEAYWQAFHFDELKRNSFDNTQFRLLRNQARITVRSTAQGFTFTGFCVNNAPNKGTVAPFEKKHTQSSDVYNDPHRVYDDVLYLFPRDPNKSTILAGYNLAPKGRDVGGGITNKNDIFVYEYRNADADRSQQVSIIVYGNRAGKAPAYYKVDLAQQLKDAAGNYIGSQLYDIVRNFHYTVTIENVEGNGYPTYEEAARNPAGNNIFASVELLHYGSVSNGSYALVIDNTDALMTLPGRYETLVRFIDDANGNHPDLVRVYLNGKECTGDITGDPNISYANYNKSNGGLYINIKEIPRNEERTLNFTIIGTAPNGGHIQRNLLLQLSPRFHFYPELKEFGGADNPQGEKVSLTFTIPGTLHENLYPYSVYIAADYLSPYVDAFTNNDLKVVRRGDRIFYEYVVKEKPANGLDKRETIYFKRTLTDKSGVVTLVSNNYIDADVLLNESATHTTPEELPLFYTGLSYTEPRIFASRLRTSVKAEVVSGAAIRPTVSMSSAGYLRMIFSDDANLSSRIKLTATMHHAGGDIICTKTMTKAEWQAALTHSDPTAGVVMDIDEIIIRGSMLLVDWRTNPTALSNRGSVPVPNNLADVSITSTRGTPVAQLTIPQEGKYTFKVSNLSTMKEPVTYQIEFTAKPSDGQRTKFTSNSIYLGKLLEDPSLSISE